MPIRILRSQWLRRCASKLTAGALLAACSSDSTSISAPIGSAGAGAFVVSASHARAQTTSTGGSAARSTSSSAAAGVVYVALPPGSIPGASTAAIRVRATGATASPAVVDGGFDPVAVTAHATDTLDIAVSMSNGSTPTTYTAPVPKNGRPVVIRTAPPTGKRDVPLNTTIVVVFSEPIAPASVAGSSIQLNAGSTAVAGAVAFGDTARLTTTLVPISNLASATDYTLTVTTAIEDDDGQTLASPTVVTFTTADTDPVAHLSIDQDTGWASYNSIMIDVGDRAHLSATVTDAAGVQLAGRQIAWSTSAPAVATVSTDGIVTAAGPGWATITASAGRGSDTLSFHVVQLNFEQFQLSVHATDDAGAPIVGALVQEEYEGARPPDCLICSVPYGSVIDGVTDVSGVFATSFVAGPNAIDDVSICEQLPHATAYVVVKDLPNYETDRRFIGGSSPTNTLAIHLHALAQISAVDTSFAVTIAASDPLNPNLSNSEDACVGDVSRVVRLRAATSGLLTVSAAPTTTGTPQPDVEVDLADESNDLAFGTSTTTLSVRAGDVVQVRISTHINAGEPPQSFLVHTVIAAPP